MKVATVLESSLPVSMIRKQSGIISVVRRKLMTSESSIFTKAPITPRLVSRKYSKGRVLLTVFKNGYKKRGICAVKNSVRVSGWEATHWRRARALQTRLDAWAEREGGDSRGYMESISCRRAAMVPKECHKIGARSGKASRFLLNSRRAVSRISGLISSRTNAYIFSFSAAFSVVTTPVPADAASGGAPKPDIMLANLSF
mmetsp:Transcript_18266/g.30019  ORF Transcript_18266/g.30019 Transcript_18266/m.30019 type:complete len:200 (-) Transcript_18266:70-669(-)